jgi:hypothetical protein
MPTNSGEHLLRRGKPILGLPGSRDAEPAGLNRPRARALLKRLAERRPPCWLAHADGLELNRRRVTWRAVAQLRLSGWANARSARRIGAPLSYDGPPTPQARSGIGPTPRAYAIRGEVVLVVHDGLACGYASERVEARANHTSDD